MQTIPKNRTELAAWLGIAKSAVTEQAKRGMPVDSLEAAQAWRAANLNPARVKGSRFDPSKLRPPQQDPGEAVKRAAAMLDLAHAELDAGRDIDRLEAHLRAALRAVAPPLRDSLPLHADVIRYLVRHVLALLPDDQDALNDDGSPVWDEDLSDGDAQACGEFWYGVACGEWVLNP